MSVLSSAVLPSTLNACSAMFRFRRHFDDCRWDVNKSERKFVSMIENRDANDVDNCFNWRFDVDNIRKFYLQAFQGFDKEGRPVYFERMGWTRRGGTGRILFFQIVFDLNPRTSNTKLKTEVLTSEERFMPRY